MSTALTISRSMTFLRSLTASSIAVDSQIPTALRAEFTCTNPTPFSPRFPHRYRTILRFPTVPIIRWSHEMNAAPPRAAIAARGSHSHAFHSVPMLRPPAGGWGETLARPREVLLPSTTLGTPPSEPPRTLPTRHHRQPSPPPLKLTSITIEPRKP